MNNELNVPIGVSKRLARVLNEELPALGDVETTVLLDLIYKTTDFYQKKVVEPGAVCKKGCSWCCRVPVTVSAIEAHYIQEKTGAVANKLKAGGDWSREPDKTKCPFLKNDECSIYEARPFNCRTFASMDSAEFCVDASVPHKIATWESNNGLIAMRDILDTISAQFISQEYGIASHGDVREWFGDNKISVKTI